MSQYEQYLRLLREGRLHPWLPEHKVFIDGELAKFTVTDPKYGLELQARYDAKMAKYIAENPPVKVPLEATDVVEDATELDQEDTSSQSLPHEENPSSQEIAVPVPKKRGRKKKLPPQ